MPENGNGRDKEEYTFIQEKIIPKKKKKWKKVLGVFGSTVALAVIFGLVARAVFCYSEPLFNRLFGIRPQTGENGVQLDGPGQGTGTGSAISGDPNGDGDTQGSGQGTGEGGTGEEGTGTDGENGGTQSGDGDSKAEKEEPCEEPETVIIENTIKGDISDFTNIYYQIGELAEEVNRSVVRVSSVTNGMDWFQNPYEMEDVTCGLILALDDDNVYILVNYDRIEQANEIRVTFDQEVSATARFRDAQPNMGLAVVLVRKADLPRETADELIAAPLGESYTLAVGEPVIALGNPNGHMYSMLLGMVTNKMSYAYVADNKLELFHTDIMLGQTGEGIIADLDGNIVGLITRTLGEEQEYCTALSISRISQLLEMMINQVPRVYLGVIGVDVPEAVAAKLPQSGGVYVSGVEEGSPAALAGIKAGDVILQVGENAIFTMSGFSTYIQSMNPGTEVPIKVYRMIREDAVEQEFKVTLGQTNQMAK